mmetsp:Transcript_4574/g.10720  ORF Transcript_4574/g.10720 Transcript_4574/m.10720 type:complete len:219 (+) Transcript_4574:513-1169(+)
MSRRATMCFSSASLVNSVTWPRVLRIILSRRARSWDCSAVSAPDKAFRRRMLSLRISISWCARRSAILSLKTWNSPPTFSYSLTLASLSSAMVFSSVVLLFLTSLITALNWMSFWCLVSSARCSTSFSRDSNSLRKLVICKETLSSLLFNSSLPALRSMSAWSFAAALLNSFCASKNRSSISSWVLETSESAPFTSHSIPLIFTFISINSFPTFSCKA